jgi:peptidoglycan/xylan/chitin deacetylase (PgdA/CDA1 family)
MFRTLIKSAVAFALDTAGSERIVNAISPKHTQPLVLGYHQVVQTFRTDSRCGIRAMQISCSMLEKHLDWIAQRYRIVSLDEIGDQFKNGETPNRPSAAITFDDGYRDVYQNAFPLLVRKGIPATIFVVTDIVGTTDPPLHDRLYLVLARAFEQWSLPAVTLAELLNRLDLMPSEPKRVAQSVPDAFLTLRALLDTLSQSDIHRLLYSLEAEFRIEQSVLEEFQPLNWEMLAEMSQAGMTIGSHTKTHALLTSESGSRIREEIDGSRQALEKQLGTPVKHFAYPDGRFDVRTARAVEASGIQFAYTTCRHQLPEYPLFTIPRKLLWENSCMDSLHRFSPAIMKCQVSGTFDRVRGCTQKHDRAFDGATFPNEMTGVDAVSIRNEFKS